MIKVRKKKLNTLEKNKIDETSHSNTAKHQQYILFIKEKLKYLQEIVQDTFLSIDMYKKNNLFSNISVLQCFHELSALQDKVTTMETSHYISTLVTVEDTEAAINRIQTLFNEVLSLFSKYGTRHLQSVLHIFFRKDYVLDLSKNLTSLQQSKLTIILKYVSPTGYNNSTITHRSPLDCAEPDSIDEQSYRSIHEIRVFFPPIDGSGSILLHGWVPIIPCTSIKNERYIDLFIQELIDGFTQEIERQTSSEIAKHYNMELFQRFIKILSIKDMLVYSKTDIYKKFATMINHVITVKTSNIKEFIKHFFNLPIIYRREMLIHLLLYNQDNEVQYIAYMLYDLMGTNSEGEVIDCHEQKELYNTFPWYCKQYFKETLTNTYEFSQERIYKPDVSKVSLEQQVLLLRCNEKIKQRAILKLKEVKEKSDEGGGKAKQYLDGLVRVPFGVYAKEPLLSIMPSINQQFLDVCNSLPVSFSSSIPKKVKYTAHEITIYTSKIKHEMVPELLTYIERNIGNLSKKEVTSIVAKIASWSHSDMSKKKKREMIEYIVNQTKQSMDPNRSIHLGHILEIIHAVGLNTTIPCPHSDIYEKIVRQEEKQQTCGGLLQNVSSILDQSIYGHTHAKEELVKIIGQWMNGEQTGYCFGFEGAPGLGKTSLAKKGLAKCLQSDNGVSRPFSFIAMGGSCNGSTLEGHNYTYLNSTWGKIVDILMESGCMNPIIYIDELDKVSKTEQGREIIGILMHLIDTSQNEEFNDKYFNIPFDLSKALFIFSYNDPDQIDRILLDRIHRIKFEPLSTKEKLVVVKQFIIPELDKKMGFCNTVFLSDDVIYYIIETYTLEPGVRKLKEILFDLFGEINVSLLRQDQSALVEYNEFPITIKEDDLGKTYLAQYTKVQKNGIHSRPSIGRINGLWANHYGRGGIISIETVFFPSSSFFELKLTGLQGDVMKESMNVAKSLAWNLTSVKTQEALIKAATLSNSQGIHIHCPEGAVSKDGPSAGAAITLAIYSLLNGRRINNTVAITGEVNLQGEIMAIGGLEHKIQGAIAAGVKTLLYPCANKEDYEHFVKKNKGQSDVSGIVCIQISTIQEALSYTIIEDV